MAERAILVVDDDTEMRALLVEVLHREGYLVEEAANGAQATSRLRGQRFAAIVMDKNLPGLGGLYLLQGIRMVCPETPVIVITTFSDSAAYAGALRGGALEYLFKPFRMEDLLDALRRALPPVEGSDSAAHASGEGR